MSATHESDYLATDYDSSAAEDSYISNYDSPECALLAYSRFNKIDKLRVLLEAKRKKLIKLDLNFKGYQKQNSSWSALHLASYFGNYQVVDELLRYYKSEIDIDIQNSSGDTPLHKAAFTNRERVVQLLLSHGADIYVRNNDGQLAKDMTHNNEILELIGAAEAADSGIRKRELFSAAVSGDLKFIQTYVACSIDPNNDNDSTTQTIKGKSYGPRLDLRQICDDNGNTLLHLAALRNQKAVCIYLLEQGCNAYQKNNRGQTCIDLALPQMKQVLLSVKPTESQLDKLTRLSVGRFEGPLMRRVRFLGWKSSYVVLENGVFLVFNNKNDLLNKSRRYYKYLESATISLDPSNNGVFSICFSDRTHVTLLVPKSSRLVGPTSNNSSSSNTGNNIGTSVEFERQKWVDAISDHIRYSTEFIRRGLKELSRGDDDDIDDSVVANLSNLDQLLPLDTIKSIMQEARAHQSILERHVDLLVSLIQDAKLAEETSNPSRPSSSGLSNNSLSRSTTARPTERLGFLSRIRSASSQSSNPGYGEEGQSRFYTQDNNHHSTQSESEMQDTLRDNWPSILFHLKLVMESSNNTKTTMSQALSLMEHQEVIRQQRLQDQEERCRVLEESLQMLARDHFELERSLSMNPMADQSLRTARSMTTMSTVTDMNDYVDAFEDFDDDDKTVTPTSIPSDDDLDEFMAHSSIKISPERIRFADEAQQHQQQEGSGVNDLRNDDANHNLMAGDIGRANAIYEDDDDARSDCSALTIEGESELDNNIVAKVEPSGSQQLRAQSTPKKFRTKLPAPAPQGSMSLWNILKNCIGRDLSKITFPVVFNEPLSMLQRYSEFGEHIEFLEQADNCDDPADRMELICAYYLSGLSASAGRLTKPSNPIMNETYELHLSSDKGAQVKGVAEQVSHHPPISAFWAESPHHEVDMYISPKIRFWGRSVEIDSQGGVWLRLKNQNELYTYPTLKTTINNILMGKMWLEVHGSYEIINHTNGMKLQLTLHSSSWFGRDAHRFDGFIVDAKGKKLRYVYGKWTEYLKSVNYEQNEKYFKNNPLWPQQQQQSPKQQQEAAKLTNQVNNLSLNNSADSQNNNNETDASKNMSGSSASGDRQLTKNESSQSLEIPNSRTIWKIQKGIQSSEYYNFTPFAMTLNELTDELAKSLPRTDSRFRPDVRKLEHGDLDGAAAEKERLEEKQRVFRKATRAKGGKDTPLWFDEVEDRLSKKKRYIFNKKYWDAKVTNPSSFPDIF